MSREDPITVQWALGEMNKWHGRAKAAEEERDRLREAIGDLYMARGEDVSRLRARIRRTFGIADAFRKHGSARD